MKVFAIIILTLSATALGAPKNLPLNNGQVSIPLPPANGKGYGWILFNEFEIMNFGWKTTPTKENFSFTPVHGYGAKFFLQEYDTADRIDFYGQLAALLAGRTLKFQEANHRDEQGKIIDEGQIIYGNTTKHEYFIKLVSTDDETIQSYAYAIQEIIESSVNETILSKDDSKDIWKKLLKCKFPPNDTCKDSPINKDSIDIELLKAKIIDAQNRLGQIQPVNILLSGGKISTTKYAARKYFTSATMKVGSIFIPGEQAFSYSAHLSYYPFTEYNLNQSVPNVLDRISLDIGLIDKPKNSEASSAFTNATKRYMIGVGYELGLNVAVQAGNVLWYEPSHTHKSFYFGVSVDILNLGQSIANLYPAP